MRRVTTSSRSVGFDAALPAAAMSLLLLLQFAQMIFQPIEALFPEPAVVLQPVGGILERVRGEPAGPPLRLATARDEPGALQHLEVLGDRRKAHRERLGERCAPGR